MLSRPSPLQGLSDFHSRRHRITYTLRFRFPAICSGENKDGADLSFYFFFLSQHAATLTPGPLQVHVPITSLQALAFAHPVEARRIRRPPATISQLSGSPSNNCRIHASRGCSVRLILRPAVSVGASDWVPPHWTKSLACSVLGYHVGAIAT